MSTRFLGIFTLSFWTILVEDYLRGTFDVEIALAFWFIVGPIYL